ncbi:tumor necrosis factor receptor superfamily member 18 [Zalophus californianus]|uniref:Tumor necrosis factor receptor superfamily member 18 n=1 Tax=Zalophus californianus TaxID=9704 RepID=A0A6J2F9L7_ZALCA|nr:tumor necrosis factor receptor superfamily member 18 [Zalophus californianus]XP_027964434.1 tumor necrosis factor receptor superfamily member 18 isoform X2 [Eumetopias jubatus]
MGAGRGPSPQISRLRPAVGAMEARGARVALCGVTLLCAMGLGQRPAGGLSCGPDRLLRGTGTDTRCCRLCTPAEACPEGDCTCVEPGYHCGDPQCKTCKHHTCPPGQEVRPHGNFNFGFECVDCATGTFSGGQEGRCKPWSDCSQFGYTMFPGNKTHNAVCSLGLPPAEPHGLLTIVLLTVAACILVLSAAQLGLHIWQLRRQPVWPPETQLPLEARPPAEDACSCQFPEEERGEQLLEDKGQLRDLWV